MVNQAIRISADLDSKLLELIGGYKVESEVSPDTLSTKLILPNPVYFAPLWWIGSTNGFSVITEIGTKCAQTWTYYLPGKEGGITYFGPHQDHPPETALAQHYEAVAAAKRVYIHFAKYGYFKSTRP